MSWQPGDVPFVQNGGDWTGTDFGFNENTNFSAPGQQYQIVTNLPASPTSVQEGTLFYVLGEAGVAGTLFVLIRNSAGVLTYVQLSGKTVRLKMSSASTTPTGGIDAQSVSVVPWAPGTPTGVLTPIAWNVTDIFFRVEGAGAGTTSLTIQRSTSHGLFVVVNNINATPVQIVAGLYEPTIRPPAINQPLVNSGDKLAASYSIGPGASNFTTYVTLMAV